MEDKKISRSNTRLFRILKLYERFKTDPKPLRIDKICAKFAISERTLRRDIQILKEIFPGFSIHLNRKWTVK